MALSDEFTTFVLDQLHDLGSFVSKKMFGGAGIYANGIFFALIADDILYFKVDESNFPDFEQAGMGPFRPYGKESYTMKYYEVPISVPEDAEELFIWANKAINVAKRGK